MYIILNISQLAYFDSIGSITISKCKEQLDKLVTDITSLFTRLNNIYIVIETADLHKIWPLFCLKIHSKIRHLEIASFRWDSNTPHLTNSHDLIFSKVKVKVKSTKIVGSTMEDVNDY